MSGAVPHRLRIERPSSPARVEPPHLTLFAESLPLLRGAWKVSQQYPPEHPQVSESIHAASAALGRAIAAKSPLTCVVVDKALSLDGLPIDEKRPGVAELAEGLFRRGIRALTFFQGLGEQDVRELVAVLCADARELFDQGGGAQVLARKKGLTIRATAVKQAEVTAADEEPATPSAAPEDRLRKLDVVTASRVRLTSQLSALPAETPEEAEPGVDRADPGLIAYLTGETDELTDRQYFHLLATLDDPERLRNLITVLVSEQMESGSFGEREREMVARTLSRIATLLRARSPHIWNDCKTKLATAVMELGDHVAMGVFSATGGLSAELESHLGEIASQLSDDDACRLLANACSQTEVNPVQLGALFQRVSQDADRATSLAELVKEALRRIHGSNGVFGDTLEPIFVEMITAHLGGDEELERAMLSLRSHRLDAAEAERIQSEIRDLLGDSTLSSRAEAVTTLMELLEQETDTDEYRRLLESVQETFAELTRESEYALLRELLATLRRHAQEKPAGVLDLAQEFLRKLARDPSTQRMFLQTLFSGKARWDGKQTRALLGIMDELAGDVVSLLVAVLRDPSRALQDEAVESATISVSQRLATSRKCVALLVELQDERGWSALIEIATSRGLSKENVLLRREAIYQLGAGGAASAIPALTHVLRRKTFFKRSLNSYLRLEAATALASLMERSDSSVAEAARRALAPAASDSDPLVREVAQRASQSRSTPS